MDQDWPWDKQEVNDENDTSWLIKTEDRQNGQHIALV